MNENVKDQAAEPVKKREFSEIIEAVRQDKDWGVPEENRDWLLYGMGWALNKL